MAKENRYDYRRILPDPIGLDVNSLYDPNPRFTSAVGLVWDKDNTLIPAQDLTGISTLASGQIVRMWYYETLPTGATDSNIYIIASVFDPNTSLYSLATCKFNGSSWATSWTAVTDYRDVNSSTRVHQVVFSRGLAYVRGFPTGGDLLGTVILDGSSGSIVTKPWGMLGPDTPARIVGAVDMLNGTLSSTATTITVDSTTGFPASGRLQIGYERIDYSGTTATTFTGCTRGVDGTTAEEHADGTTVIWRDWAASDHPVTVTTGWKYTYAYVSITNQVSNRADVEYNPDLMPSFTGPFKNLVPKITLQGLADTTNFPYINVYRTTDGGGTFYLLEQIANPGAGAFTYLDDSFGTGASSSTYNDPVPDLKINTAVTAPSLTSNSPPPVVTPPEVVGVDEPAVQSYAICAHVGRIWMGVKNYLLYSALEELVDGIGEESFPSGTLGGNYLIFNSLITGLVSNNSYLYVFTESNIYKLSGSTRDSFTIQKVSDIGCKLTVTNGAVAAYDNQVAFIGSNGGIYLLEDDRPRLISNPIERGFNSGYPYSGSNSVLGFFENNLYKYLLVSAGGANVGVPDTHTRGIIYVYNLKKSQEYNYDFWNPQWNVLNGTLLTVNSGTLTAGIYSTNYNELAPVGNTILRRMDFTYNSFPEAVYSFINDDGTTSNTSQLGSAVTQTNYIRIPSGNLVNFNNIPGRSVKCERIYVNSYHFSGSNPYSIRVDFDNSSEYITGSYSTGSPPPKIKIGSTPYTIKTFPLKRLCYQCRISLTPSNVYCKFSDIFVEFFPGYTATD